MSKETKQERMMMYMFKAIDEVCDGKYLTGGMEVRNDGDMLYVVINVYNKRLVKVYTDTIYRDKCSYTEWTNRVRLSTNKLREFGEDHYHRNK